MPASPAKAPMRGTSDAAPAESSAWAAASASRSASRSSSSSTSLRVRTSISPRTVVPAAGTPRRLAHEHVELAGPVDGPKPMRLRDAARASVPLEDRHPEPRGRIALDDMRQHRAHELPAESLPHQVGPHAVADVDRPGLLLDAGHPRLRSHAAEADELAVLALDCEKAQLPSERPFGVIRRVRPGVTPGERPLGLLVGQVPRPHGGVSRAA